MVAIAFILYMIAKAIIKEVSMQETQNLDLPLWGVRSIAAAINRSPRSTLYLLESGRLPAAKVGGRWVSSRKRLRDHLDSLIAGGAALNETK